MAPSAVESTVSAREVVLQRLQRFLPIRVLVRVAEDGVLHGMTELSFSMGSDPKYVNIFWSGTAYSILGEFKMDGVRWAEENRSDKWTVIDPLSPGSPIEVNWARWLDAVESPTGMKFDKRNAPFTVKE